MQVIEEIRASLHDILARNDNSYLIGEDIGAPTGGAFGVCRGLSTEFRGRVISTPISELGLSGFAAGLALSGSTVVSEFMFSDFITLGMDPIVNFAAKVSSGMFGSNLPMRWIIRCPSGGYRGYGATHSQSFQKLLMGWPGIFVFEASRFTRTDETFSRMLSTRSPCVFFEEKTLYAARTIAYGSVLGDLFEVTQLEPGGGAALISLVDHPVADCLIVAHGGIADLALEAMRVAAMEMDIVCTLIVPTRLFPLEEGLVELAVQHRAIVVVEESTPGCGLASEVAMNVLSHPTRDPNLRFASVTSESRPIPASIAAERQVLVSAEDVVAAIQGVCS